MNQFRLLVVTLLLFVLSQQVVFAQNKKLDKTLRKVDNYYRIGNLPKAQKSLKKFKAGALKLGTESNYLVEYYIREAHLNLSQGLLPMYEESVINAMKMSGKIFGETSKNYANTLSEIASMYNEYGNFRLGRDYAERAWTILEKSGQLDDDAKAKLALVRGEALVGQGFCREALVLLRSAETYYAGRAVDKETYVENGAIKTRRLEPTELPARFETYAATLTWISRAYGRMGNFDSMDSAFAAARTWIKKNKRFMGETTLAEVRNDFLQALTYIENDANKGPQAYLHLDNILNDLKKVAAPTNTLAHEVYLEYIQELLNEDYKAKFSNVKLEYQKVLNKYFPKNSVHFANLNAIVFSSKLHNDQTRNLEAQALAMLNSKSVPKNYKTTERVSLFLTEVALTNKNYANVEKYFKDLIDIKKELYGETSVEYHLARVILADYYVDYTNNIDQAGKLFEESFLSVVSKAIHHKHKDNLEILLHLAKYYELTDRYKLAAQTLAQCSYVAGDKFDDKDPLYAIVEDYIAGLNLEIGGYEAAENSINIAYKILDDNRKDPRFYGDFIHLLETQARLYGIKGLYDEAEENLKRADELIKDSKVTLGSDVGSAEQLSALLILLGKYSDASDLLEDQIPGYEKLYGKESLRLIEPLVNSGRIALAKGDYTEAERTAIKANTIAVKVYGDISTKTAPTQKLLADIYYTLGDYDKAEANALKAIRSQEKQFGRMHVELAKSISQLALIKFYKGDDHKEIEKLMLEARDIIEVKLTKDNPQYAEILKNVAVLYISEGRVDVAFNSLTIAEQIWRKKNGRKNNINLASIYTLTGDVYYQLKNYSKAEGFYYQSKDLYEKFFSTRHPEYVKVLSKLSKVYYMEGDYKRSKKMIEEALGNYENFIKLYFPALSEREKAKYWNTIKGDFEFYNTLAFSNLEDFKDLTGKVYTYQLLTKALLLSSSIKIRERILGSSDDALKNLYNTWIQRKETLTLALSMSPAQLTENKIDTEALQQEVERLEKEISEKSEIFGQSFDNKRITFEDVRKSLKPNEVAMELVRYRHFNHTFTDSVIYAALYVKPENAKPKAIILGDGKKMETRYFKFYRNAITGKLTDNISYKVYWQEISEELGQVSTVYLSADGIYNQLNLESIRTPDGRFIIDNSNIVLVSNTKDIYSKKMKSVISQRENTASMFGNPKFYLASASGAISSLPGTEKEVNQLQFLLKEKGWITSEYVEDRAAEEAIKEINSPKIFHIATHGLYKPSTQMTFEKEIQGNEALMAQNPLMRTGLLLKGAGDLLDKTSINYNMESGILTAYEAMSLNLDQTDLVVLSACETGLGDLEAGEGVYGLQRAFLVAGAKVLIMSMFKVDDEATQKLMLKFYQKWLTSGNLRQSFIDAKKELRIDYPEPIYWGAFMMIGLE